MQSAAPQVSSVVLSASRRQAGRGRSGRGGLTSCEVLHELVTRGNGLNRRRLGLRPGRETAPGLVRSRRKHLKLFV